MTTEKLYDLFEFYYNHTSKNTDVIRCSIYQHLREMCNKAHVFVEEERIEKAMRWLGFIQGVLWSHSIFTLDELKNHSKPDES